MNIKKEKTKKNSACLSPFGEHLHGVPLQTGLLLEDLLLQHQAFGVAVILLQRFGDEVQTVCNHTHTHTTLLAYYENYWHLGWGYICTL